MDVEDSAVRRLRALPGVPRARARRRRGATPYDGDLSCNHGYFLLGTVHTHRHILGCAAAQDRGLSKVIHTSTSEVYGTASFVPIDENHPLQGQSPYSASKIGADQIAKSFHCSFGTPVVILRPFNTYGPRQSTRAVIPTIICQIANGQKCINLGSIEPTRDFNFITDIVNGFLLTMKSETCIGEVINLGNNFEISIGETAKIISNIMGIEIEILTDEQRFRPKNSEVERLWADNTKAKRMLGWEPKYSGLEGLKLGLSKTAEWFSNESNLDIYKSKLYNI